MVIQFFSCKESNPAKIGLEGVLKTSCVFIFRRCLQDVLIKTIIFVLLIRFQKTSSGRLQEDLIKTNIFLLAIRLEGVLKTFLRRLLDVFKTSCQDVLNTFLRGFWDVLQKHLQDMFKMCCKDVFKTSSKRLWNVLKICFQDIFKTCSTYGQGRFLCERTYYF